MVYEENIDGGLYCLNAFTGQLVWKFQGGQYYSGNPLVGDGMVYSQVVQDMAVNPQTDQLLPPEYACLNATTGALIWSNSMFDQGGASDRHTDSACLAYGALYIATPIKNGLLPQNVSNAKFRSTLYYVHPAGLVPVAQNPAHSGNGASGPENLTVAWIFTAKGGFDSSASIVAGKVYVGCLDGNIYCLDAETGHLIWNYQTGARIHSSPAVANGMVYTGGENGYFYALDADTGSVIWKTPSGFLTSLYANYKPVIESSPCAINGNVYIGSNNGTAFCLNGDTGGVKWTYDAGQGISGSIAVVNGLAYVPVRTASYWFKPDTGSMVWQATMAGEAYSQRSSPVIANGRLYIGCGQMPPKLFCFDATTGSLIWVQQYPPTQDLSGANVTSSQYAASPVYANGLVYLSHEFSAIAVNATTGALVWDTYLDRESFGSITYAGGYVYTGRTTGVFYVLDATTGAKLSFYIANSEIDASASLSGGKVYIGCWDWNFYCFEQANPELTTYNPANAPTGSSTSANPTPTPVTTTPTPVSATPTPVSATPTPVTATPTPTAVATATPTSQVTATPTSTGTTKGTDYTPYIYAAIVVIVIIIIVVAALMLLRRKKKTT